MPNPGGVRISVAIVAAVGLLYSLATGEELPPEQKQAWSDALGNGVLTLTTLYALGASLYSRFFPSKPA
jgi:hypothetical protein